MTPRALVADQSAALPWDPCVRAPWWNLPALTLLVAAAYGRTVGFEFVLDDRVSVLGDTVSGWHVGLWNILSAPTSAFLGQMPGAERMYRPLLALTMAMDRALWGIHPGGFHLTNVLAHLGAVLAVWRLALWLSGDAATAADPLNAEAFLALGRAHAAAHRSGEAETALAAAVQLNPGLVPAYLELSALYAAGGALDRAIALLDRGIQARRDEPMLVARRAALAARRRGSGL